MRTSTPIALFSFALALYAAPFAQAASSSKNVRQLSDQNLFEVHLQNGLASSHKRLPSEVISHHERSEEEDEEESLALPVGESSKSTTTSSSSTSETADNADASSGSEPKKYTARQPSHFIKHFKHRSSRMGKRRLTDSQDVFANVHFERDSDDLDSSIWDIPALVARVIDSTSASSSSTPVSSRKSLLSALIVHCADQCVLTLTETPAATSSHAEQSQPATPSLSS